MWFWPMSSYMQSCKEAFELSDDFLNVYQPADKSPWHGTILNDHGYLVGVCSPVCIGPGNAGCMRSCYHSLKVVHHQLDLMCRWGTTCMVACGWVVVCSAFLCKLVEYVGHEIMLLTSWVSTRLSSDVGMVCWAQDLISVSYTHLTLPTIYAV